MERRGCGGIARVRCYGVVYDQICAEDCLLISVNGREQAKHRRSDSTPIRVRHLVYAPLSYQVP